MIVELCVLVGSEVYDIRLNAVWALMVSGYLCTYLCVPHILNVRMCTCDQTCSHAKIAQFLPQMQNLMGNLLKLTELKYSF